MISHIRVLKNSAGEIVVWAIEPNGMNGKTPMGRLKIYILGRPGVHDTWDESMSVLRAQKPAPGAKAITGWTRV